MWTSWLSMEDTGMKAWFIVFVVLIAGVGFIGFLAVLFAPVEDVLASLLLWLLRHW